MTKGVIVEIISMNPKRTHSLEALPRLQSINDVFPFYCGQFPDSTIEKIQKMYNTQTKDSPIWVVTSGEHFSFGGQKLDLLLLAEELGIEVVGLSKGGKN